MSNFHRDPIWDAVSSWHHKNPDAGRFPMHILNEVEKLERREDVRTAHMRVSIDPYQLEEIRSDLDAQAMGWKKHREAEEQLAAYIRDVDAATGWQPLARNGKRSRTLLELADDLEHCRRAGAVGLKPDGGTMIAWETKCGQVHLCPDESREETQRLTEFYLPALMDWAKAKPTHRLFYAVFTDHNFRPGQLAAGKKYLFDKFSEWRTYRPHACPVSFVKNGYGMFEAVRSRRQYMDAPFKLEGALVIQEDPLSANGDWNVHLNAFLMVDGQFDYKVARELWGGNVHFQEINGEPGAIRRALLEAIKYSARIVPEKSASKSESAASEAPAMTEWPHLRWLEWWQSQGGFRRVRSYGELYALHGKRWEAMDVKDRVHLCADAEIDYSAAQAAWCDLSDEEKTPLRRAMVHGERLDMSLVEWIGSVSANADGSLWVDLIPGNNFSGSSQPKSTSRPISSLFSTGPPGPYH